MTFYSRLKLRGKIITLLLLFGLIPAITVFSIFMMYQGNYQADRMRPLREMARSINDVIDRNLFERYGDVQAFTLNQAVQNQNNWGSNLEDNPLVSAMNGYMANYGIYQLMIVLDTQGRVVAINTRNAKGQPLNTAGLLGQDFSQQSWFKNAIQGNFTNGTDGLTGTVVEQPMRVDFVGKLYGNDGFVIPFSAPIKNATRDITGVWVNFADFGLVDHVVASFYDQAKKEGMVETEIALIDSNGVMLVDYDPNEGKDLTKPRDWAVIGTENIIDHFPQVKPVLAREDNTVITEHEGSNHYLAAGYAASLGALGFPGMGWATVVQVPVESIFTTLYMIVYKLLAVVILGALATVIVGYLTGNSFARPLQKITEAMNQLSNNRTDINLDIKRLDEIGDLASAYEVFRQNAISRNQEMTRMKEIETRVKEVAKGINQATREIAEGNMNLSERTEAQAANVEQTTASMQQITETVAASADNAKNALQLASAARSAADKGGEVASFAMSAMQDISDSSKRIVDIIGVIDNIAFQTNLLALNAAVEAARAGEQGRGFAVVASEVRALANRSASAAKEIKTLIGESVEKINSGVTQVSETASCLRDIIANVQQVTTVVSSIATASTEQASSIAELNKAVAQMDAFTQQNAALVEEAASASKALEDQTSTLVKAVS